MSLYKASNEKLIQRKFLNIILNFRKQNADIR